MGLNNSVAMNIDCMLCMHVITLALSNLEANIRLAHCYMYGPHSLHIDHPNVVYIDKEYKP